jgi:hypothetical protein
MFTPFAFIRPPDPIINAYTIYLSDPAADRPSTACATGLSRTPTPYYTDDVSFPIASIIYTQPTLTIPFNGDNLYYSVYDDTEAPYGIYIQIDKDGIIIDTGICE